jgi:hypothetical protein
MNLGVLLAALVLAVLPALAPPERRAPSLPSDSEGMSRAAVGLNRWPRWRAGLSEFWNQQLHLHQLYLNSFDVSGGDALDAVARRKPSGSAPD